MMKIELLNTWLTRNTTMALLTASLSGVAVTWAPSSLAQNTSETPAAVVDPYANLSPRQIVETGVSKAMDLVARSSGAEQAVLRAQALEAILARPERATPMVQLGLKDNNPGVRFAAAIAAGKLADPAFRPGVRNLLRDNNLSVQAAAMFAADALGVEASKNGLPRMLTSPDFTVRSNAILVLGLMGDESAVPMIRQLTQSRTAQANSVQQQLFRVQTAETLYTLGYEGAIDELRAAMFSPDQEVRILAMLALGKIQDRQYEPALLVILREPEPIEIKMAAAEALARMDRYTGEKFLLLGMQAEYAELPIGERVQRVDGAPLRAMSAFGLSLVPTKTSATALVELLDDPNPRVQLAAAAAVLDRTR